MEMEKNKKLKKLNRSKKKGGKTIEESKIGKRKRRGETVKKGAGAKSRLCPSNHQKPLAVAPEV